MPISIDKIELILKELLGGFKELSLFDLFVNQAAYLMYNQLVKSFENDNIDDLIDKLHPEKNLNYTLFKDKITEIWNSSTVEEGGIVIPKYNVRYIQPSKDMILVLDETSKYKKVIESPRVPIGKIVIRAKPKSAEKRITPKLKTKQISPSKTSTINPITGKKISKKGTTFKKLLRDEYITSTGRDTGKYLREQSIKTREEILNSGREYPLPACAVGRLPKPGFVWNPYTGKEAKITLNGNSIFKQLCNEGVYNSDGIYILNCKTDNEGEET